MFDHPIGCGARFYPLELKKILDEYVVGQDRAKRILCNTVFNHMQKINIRESQEQSIINQKEKRRRQQAARERESQERLTPGGP